MAFAITQTCCADASCVAACPVNCIHPTPDEPEFATTDMLYVDPRACIDCGACADACPVGAVFPVEHLSAPLAEYADVNAAYYDGRPVAGQRAEGSPLFHAWDQPRFTRSLPSDMRPLDVAVVGTGPAGMYAVQDLLLHTRSRVTLIDRLETPGGLIRYGVVPDHPSTKGIGESFARFHDHPPVRMRLGVEVGRDVTVDELAESHDAVIHAVGASGARDLGVPDEDLPGNVAAGTVVGWYNGHPDVPASAVDLGSGRVVVVGTGNVAIDVARPDRGPDDLDGTPIASHALRALRESRVREVVLLARRGPGSLAATAPELRALLRRDDVDVVLDEHCGEIADAVDAAAPDTATALLREARREPVSYDRPGSRRIVFRFLAAPEKIIGAEWVEHVSVHGGVEIPAGLAVRAVGHRGILVPGLPFDETSATIPHDAGRVDGRPGHYVVGWIKRGPSGGIGTNRACAADRRGRSPQATFPFR